MPDEGLICTTSPFQGLSFSPAIAFRWPEIAPGNRIDRPFQRKESDGGDVDPVSAHVDPLMVEKIPSRTRRRPPQSG
jgi:hypothetical protein